MVTEGASPQEAKQILRLLHTSGLSSHFPSHTIKKQSVHMLWSAACSRTSSSELTQQLNIPHAPLHSEVHACCKDMNVAAHKYISSHLNVW